MWAHTAPRCAGACGGCQRPLSGGDAQPLARTLTHALRSLRPVRVRRLRSLPSLPACASSLQACVACGCRSRRRFHHAAPRPPHPTHPAGRQAAGAGRGAGGGAPCAGRPQAGQGEAGAGRHLPGEPWAGCSKRPGTEPLAPAPPAARQHAPPLAALPGRMQRVACVCAVRSALPAAASPPLMDPLSSD